MNRLTTFLLVGILLTTIGLGWVFDRGFEQFAEPSIDQDIDKVRIFELLATTISETVNEFNSLQEFEKYWAQSQHVDHIELQFKSLAGLALPAQLSNQLVEGEPLLLETEQHLAFHFYLEKHQQVLVLTAQSSLFDSQQSKGDVKITVLFYVALAILIGLSLIPLVRQLHRLRRSAIAFGRGDLEQRVVSSKFSYIADIEYEFNQMAQRVEDLVSDVKLLGSAVSHDLRTPLAKLRFGLDTLQEETDPQQREIYIGKLNNNLDQMSDLLEVLLSYARMDQARLTLNLEPLDLEILINNAVMRAESSGIKITFLKPTQTTQINADNGYLSMMIDNLLGNALQHAKSTINIQLLSSAQSIQLSVEDDGAGVSAVIGQNCFKPFVRGLHKNGTIGHGMGLAIVARICYWHGGSIELKPHSELGGACFVVDLPQLQKVK